MTFLWLVTRQFLTCTVIFKYKLDDAVARHVEIPATVFHAKRHLGKWRRALCFNEAPTERLSKNLVLRQHVLKSLTPRGSAE